jgi:pimeloyl-ACP methyl ester carboxylesterase
MIALMSKYQVAAIDLRGYNLSDKPQGGEYYQMRHLVSDIQAVIRYLEKDRSIIMGHDWGGVIAWFFAMYFPTTTERLIVLNTPHPSGIVRELAQNPQQQMNSSYARDFQQEGAHKQLTPESLSAWVHDPVARERYIEAFRRSDFDAMLQYYKQNYPRQPYQNASFQVNKVQVPVLQIHGLQDQYLLAGGLNNTWEWLDNSWTLLTIPRAGHFVQHDAADLVNRTIVNWLTTCY